LDVIRSITGTGCFAMQQAYTTTEDTTGSAEHKLLLSVGLDNITGDSIQRDSGRRNPFRGSHDESPYPSRFLFNNSCRNDSGI
jgi:hypothetical protein